jgi:myosin heavy subunit
MAEKRYFQNFNESMGRLKNISDKVQIRIDAKKKFSAELINNLQSVNTQILSLEEKINAFKNSLNELTGRANANSNEINNKNREMDMLKQQLNNLKSDKALAEKNLIDLQQKCQVDTNNLQQKINSSEAAIRALTDENSILKQKSDALAQDLSSKGELPRQHAEQLDRLTQDTRQQLANKEQENKQKIDQIIVDIQKRDQQIQQLQKQLQDKNNELAMSVQNITNTKTNIESLQAQINILTAENRDLIGRIIGATLEINKAVENLERLTNAVQDDQTSVSVNDLFKQITNSIEKISNSLQQGPLPTQMPMPMPMSTQMPMPMSTQMPMPMSSQMSMPMSSQMSMPMSSQMSMPMSSQMPIADRTIRGTGYDNIGFTIQLKDLLLGLEKNYNASGQSKYRDAMNDIKNTQNPDVIQILAKYKIGIRDGNIIGGKRTRKHKSKKHKSKKQSGGFTYKPNTKRRSISTSSSRIKR